MLALSRELHHCDSPSQEAPDSTRVGAFCVSGPTRGEASPDVEPSPRARAHLATGIGRSVWPTIRGCRSGWRDTPRAP